MYYYYQDGEYQPWKVVPSKPRLLEELVRIGAKKCTILAVSEPVDGENQDLKHKGPLYFDVDCGEDLDRAASSVRDLVSLLQEYGVERQAIQVYASGSKGFHVIVPAIVFSTGRPTKNLARIYAKMARDLYVPGLDFAPYSGKKGNTFRIPNVQREKDGKYRVPLLAEEVDRITAETYDSFVSSPRNQMSFLPDEKSLAKAPQLEALFKQHKESVKTTPVNPARAVADEDLEQFREDPPNCIETIAAGETKHSSSFNQIGMQFGSFVARAGTPRRIWKPLANRAAENTTSHGYDTANKRLSHLEAQVQYASHTKTMQFSCAAMRTVTGSSPCEGCPLFDEEKGSGQEAGFELGIEEREDGYYILGAEADRKISNFVLVPANECIEYGQAEGRWKRVGTQMDIMQNGEVLTTTMFNESSWSSKSHFVHEVEGLRDLSFIGGDADVQRIKTLVYRSDREMGEIVRTYSAGIHAHQILNRDVMVYVEPGFSVNSLKIQGTHELQGTVQAPPHITETRLPQQSGQHKEVEEALSNLLKINAPHLIAQLVGWYCAAHLRTHFQRIYQQFPTLSIWGAAGSGKTSQATLLSKLSGADYMLQDSPLNLSNVTPYALIEYCSTTTTVPRLLDEFNKTKMGKRRYDDATEIIKASWNANTIARGKPGRGANGTGRISASVVAIPITAPLVIIGEQNPDVPAIQQRSIEVMISREQRLSGAEAFKTASRMREHLLPVAKAMVLEALRTDEAWVSERMDQHLETVPQDMQERPQFSYSVVLTGLDFLESASKRMGLSTDLQLEISGLRTALREHIQAEAEQVTAAKSWSEIDAILYDIGMMIALSLSESGNYIAINKHAAVSGGKLYLDVPIVFALYKQYKRNEVVVENPKTFHNLLSNEEYFAGMTSMPAMVSNRKVACLDLAVMEEKGHIASLFSAGPN